MTKEEHADIISQAEEGKLVIGIDRAVARKFFTNTEHAEVRRSIGEPLYFERAIVNSALVLGPLALLVSAVFAVYVLGWWSSVVIPLTVVAWVGYYGDSCRGGRGLTGVSLLLLLAIAACFLRASHLTFHLWLAVLVAAFFFPRFMYVGATELLRALACRNVLAFELLLGEAVFVKQVK